MDKCAENRTGLKKRGRKNNSSNFVYIQVSSLSILTRFFTENSKEGKLSKKEKAATVEDVLCKQVIVTTIFFYIKTTIMQFYDEFMLFVIFSILIVFCSYFTQIGCLKLCKQYAWTVVMTSIIKSNESKISICNDGLHGKNHTCTTLFHPLKW